MTTAVAFAPSDLTGKYLDGLFPFGVCREEGCGLPACHEYQPSNENGGFRRVCQRHLPGGFLFCPFLGQQSKMYHSPARWVLGGGGAGGSKTFMGARLYLKQLMVERARFARGEIESSQGHALFLRRTLPEALQVIAQFKAYFRKLDPNVRWSEKYNLAEFPSAGGFRVQFGGCDDDGDWERYWGSQFTLVVMDEAVMFTTTQIDKIDQRIRSDDPVLGQMLQMYLLTNPIAGAFDKETRVYTKDWLKKRFVKVAAPETPVRVRVQLSDGRISEEIQQYIPSNLYDNPALMRDGKYEANLRSRSVAVQRALLACDWDVEEGSWVGDDWDASVHICDPFPIPNGWFKFKCGDYGWAARSSIQWIAVDPEGNFVCYRSLSTRHTTADELGLLIRDIERRPAVWKNQKTGEQVLIVNNEWDEGSDMSTVMGPMDTELWAKHGETGPSRAEEINSHGAGFYKCDKNRHSAAEQIRKRLRRRTPDAQGNFVIPGLRFFSTCWNRIKAPGGGWDTVGPIYSIPSIPADGHDPDLWDTRADDHDIDALGYGALSRALSGIEEPKDRANAAVFDVLRIRKRTEDNTDFPTWRSANGTR